MLLYFLSLYIFHEKYFFFLYQKLEEKFTNSATRKNKEKKSRKEVEEFDLLESGLNFNLCCCDGQVVENNGMRDPNSALNIVCSAETLKQLLQDRMRKELGIASA